MKIVFLDCHIFGPAIAHKDNLRNLGDITFYDQTEPSEIIARAKDADAILTVRSGIDEDIMQALPRLKYIGVFATGQDKIDMAYAQKREIVVTNVPAYSTNSTAQGAMALLLELTNHVGLHNQSVHSGQWKPERGFSYWDRPIIELGGKTLGLIGFGNIAQRFAKLAHAHDVNIIVHTRSQRTPDNSIPIKFCNLEELLEQSDIISLHCPLNSETARIINEDSLRHVKPTALLVNTARGGLIDEYALAKALCERQLAGAAVDVLEHEPPFKDNPLLNAPNCIITPHNCWSAQETRMRLFELGVKNLEKYILENPAPPSAENRFTSLFKNRGFGVDTYSLL